MSELNIRNITLIALICSCFMQIGGQLFAISVVVSTITAAPPRSFAILQGQYSYDSSGFWSVVPAVTAILFVVALIANWRTRRRVLILASLALFVCGGLFAGLVLEPQLAELVAAGYSDTVDPALQVRAAHFYQVEWAAWSIALLSGLALLLALARPAETRIPDTAPTS